jgi:hypothetical protein
LTDVSRGLNNLRKHPVSHDSTTSTRIMRNNQVK